MSRARFLSDETGAVSIEYVVLCAVTAGMGVAMLAVLQSGAAKAGADLEESSKNSAQVVQPRVRTVYDEAFMSEVYNALGLLTETELGTLTAWFDDMKAVIETDPAAYDTATREAMADVDTAIDLSWSSLRLDRPRNGTWTQAELDALPGGSVDYMAY